LRQRHNTNLEILTGTPYRQ